MSSSDVCRKKKHARAISATVCFASKFAARRTRQSEKFPGLGREPPLPLSRGSCNVMWDRAMRSKHMFVLSGAVQRRSCRSASSCVGNLYSVGAGAAETDGSWDAAQCVHTDRTLQIAAAVIASDAHLHSAFNSSGTSIPRRKQ